MDLKDQSFSVTQTNLAKKESLVKKARNKLKKLEKQVYKAKEELKAAESEWEVAEFQNEIFKNISLLRATALPLHLHYT